LLYDIYPTTRWNRLNLSLVVMYLLLTEEHDIPSNLVILNVLALAAEFGDVHSYDVNAVERFFGIFVAGLDVIG